MKLKDFSFDPSDALLMIQLDFVLMETKLSNESIAFPVVV
jgi:hypothetical protein